MLDRDKGMLSKRQYGSSKLFQPYRVVGQVASDVPFCVLALDQTLHLVVAIGKAFQIFDVCRLRNISLMYESLILVVPTTSSEVCGTCGG